MSELQAEFNQKLLEHLEAIMNRMDDLERQVKELQLLVCP